MGSLTALDIVTLFLVGGAAVLGGMRGFVGEVLSLFAWVAAVIALKFFFAPVADWLTHVMRGPGSATVLAFAMVFLVVFVAGKWVAAAISARVRRSAIGPLDRVLGVGFGAMKGLLIATLIFLVVSLAYQVWAGSASARPAWMTESRSYPLLDVTSRAVVNYVEERRHEHAVPARASAAHAS
jgi:membrane protein required for colicin V production